MDTTLSFQDILKKSFVNTEFGSTLSISDIAAVLFLTFLTGMFVFYMYRSTFQGVLYTQSFNISLVMVSIVTSLVIMTISSNVILSLGMVGALSIVRFRTAIKDSMDIVFMFWAISIGIANGAGFFKLSIMGSIFIAIILFILTKFKTTTAPFLLVINHLPNEHNNLLNFLNDKVKKYNLKSKTITEENTELVLEVRISRINDTLLEEVMGIDGVKDAVLVSYNGDYVS
jgi:uncharacterized membrane protein YhiD involved in acid resistance